MSLGLIIFLIILGLLLFIIEFMLIPGITIAGIGGAICMIAGVVLAFSKYGATVGFIVLGSTAFLMAIATYFIFRADTWRKVMLNSTIDSKADNVGRQGGRVKPGDRGITTTSLAPDGNVLIHGEFYEARAVDIPIDLKTEIEVVNIEGDILIVKPLNQ